jgi:hypothetical protein
VQANSGRLGRKLRTHPAAGDVAEANMVVSGTVKLRSSLLPEAVRRERPPGEAEVLRMNPHRADRLCAITGWPRLEAGSLNLLIAAEPFEALMRVTPLWIEDGASIVYPPRFACIPKDRGPYRYYRARATVGERSEEVLVRRPTNAISTTIELYAPVKLMASLRVANGDNVTVEIRGS